MGMSLLGCGIVSQPTPTWSPSPTLNQDAPGKTLPSVKSNRPPKSRFWDDAEQSQFARVLVVYRLILSANDGGIERKNKPNFRPAASGVERENSGQWPVNAKRGRSRGKRKAPEQ